MKALLQYDLPDEREEYRRAANGGKAFSCLEDFANYLRNEIKHGDYTAKEAALLKKIHDRFWLEIGENGVTLWD